MRESFNISVDPSKYKGIADSELNYFADVAELIALTSKSEITIGELLDRFSECGLIKKGESQLNDSNESWVKEIFGLLYLRWKTYDEKYPFDFDESERFISLKTMLSNTHKLYIQLLLSANLPFFSEIQTVLTTDFENVSYYSLKSYLSKTDNIKKFGKKTEYSGLNAIDKIKKLASDIKIDFSADDLEQVNKYNSNEKGLDVVAWFPFDDSWGNLLVVLGQCACTNRDWYKKRQDAIPYEYFFKFKGIKPIHALFIPHSLTKAKLFFNSIHINDTLLFERKRLIDNFDENNYKNLESNEVVSKVISFQEDVA